MAAEFVNRMFTIIGGDGKEYGPVGIDQLRAWMNTGRVNLDTRARVAGSEEWRRLGEFGEFSSAGAAPPVMEVPPSTFGFPTPSADASLEPASLGERFGAALVDGILEGLCWMPTATAVWAILGDQIRSGQQPSPAELMEAMDGVIFKSLPFLIFLAIVQGVLLSRRGQSIGKLLLGTRIVRFANNARFDSKDSRYWPCSSTQSIVTRIALRFTTDERSQCTSERSADTALGRLNCERS